MTEHIVHIDDIEELIIAKYFIEQYLIKEKKLENKMSIQDFVSQFLEMNTSMAIYNVFSKVEIVPFFIYQYENEIYVFFTEKNDLSEKTYSFLKSNNFDISNLKPYSGGNNMIRFNYAEYDMPL